MMSDWVHCNVCFLQPTYGKKFLLTECGHIECVECAREGKECHICNKPCQTIVLSSKMKPEIEMYFQDPAEFAMKFIRQFSQIIDFQKGHRNRFFKYIIEKKMQGTSHYKHLEQIKTLEREIQLLKEEILQLRKKISSNALNMSPAHGTTNRIAPPSAVIHPSPQHNDWAVSNGSARSRDASSLIQMERLSASSLLQPANLNCQNRNSTPGQNDHRRTEAVTTMPSRISLPTPPLLTRSEQLNTPSPMQTVGRNSTPIRNNFTAVTNQNTPFNNIQSPAHQFMNGRENGSVQNFYNQLLVARSTRK